MKEKIIKIINYIYFGIYLYTGEAFYTIFQNGQRNYYQGFWGFKLCYIMVFLYSYGLVSFFSYLIGNSVLQIINGSFLYKLIYLFIICFTSMIISRYTSLGGKEGLELFEQYFLISKIKKIKWMIIGAFAFLLGIVFLILGLIVFPVVF